MTVETIQSGDDNWLQDSPPTTNNGSSTSLIIGDRAGLAFIYRALLRFDLSSIPDAAIISSAVLSLYATTDQASNSGNFQIFRCKRNWVDSESTWNIYSTGNNWQTAGAGGANDRETTPIAELTLTASETLNEFKDWTLSGVTSKDDLDWGLENDAGFTGGFFIKTENENDDSYFFSSFDEATAANRPKLTVTYTLPEASNQPSIVVPKMGIYGGMGIGI